MVFAFVRSACSLGAEGFALGWGESGSLPASIKAVAAWFPKRERALATGIFNSGTNLGAIITPLLVPWITLRYGWPAAFIATGAIGLLWIALWLALYRAPEKHTTVTDAELTYIRSDPGDCAMPIKWTQLIGHSQIWAFAVGKFQIGRASCRKRV